MELPKNKKELKEYFDGNKDLSPDDMKKAVRNIFAKEKQERQNERSDLKKFAEQNSHLEKKEKAYKFIEYYYDNYSKTFGDYELLVLLISRGKNYKEYQSKLFSTWKEKEKSKIEDSGYSTHNGDTGESEIVKLIDTEDLFSEDVSKTSKWKIPDFWGYNRKELNTIDATMLRATEWCKISGFEGYWKRLAHDIELSIPYEIEAKHSHIQWLYSTCRSDFAIRLMTPKLQLLADISAIPNDSEIEFPWEYINYENRKKKKSNSAFIAAGIIFSLIKLGKKNQYRELINKGLEFLVNVQLPNGGWKPVPYHKNPSIETTALCIHALAIGKQDDFSYAKNKAVEWLYSQQDIWGFWFEEENPYVTSEFLTVLTLDAIELTEKNFEILTFKLTEIEEIKSNQDSHKNIYNIEVKGGTNIIGEQSINESPINSESAAEIKNIPNKQNKFWWIPRLIISIFIGLISAYLLNKYQDFPFWDSLITISSICSAVLLLRNPIRRFYRAGWYCIGIFGVLNALPQIDIFFKLTETTSDGLINKLFKLGIQEEPILSIVIILLSGYLFWLDSKEK